MGKERLAKVAALAAVLAATAAAARAGGFEANGCRVEWDGRSVTVGNSLFSKSWVCAGGRLATSSFKAAGGSEWQADAIDASASEPLSASARAARWSPVGADGVRVDVVCGGATNAIWTFPGMPGVVSVRPAGPLPPREHDLERDAVRLVEWRDALMAEAAARDHVAYGRRHVKATCTICADQTDVRDQLVSSDERLLTFYDLPFTVAATSLDCRDTLTGEGLAYVRIAPMPVSRPGREDDFIIDGRGGRVAILDNGYPVAELAYRGGEAGRRRALVAFQRALRPFRPGRDGVLLSNTWGAGNGDSRICHDFLLKEIDAGARMGVDVIQIDDGWQRGRTSNSSKAALNGAEKVWSGYWNVDPLFWTADRERFPRGLEPLVARAREKGMRFGLWFGPDSFDDAANWEKDADCLLGMHRRLGIDYFKMDAMKLLSPLALKRNRAMFDKMLRESDGAMSFDLDCTAQIRPGFFGLIDVGPIFVENRYTHKGAYWPHATLKNLWDLSHTIDTVRIRCEFANPDTNGGKTGWSPLSHARYRPDALFATAMAASPLAWMELSDVSEASAAQIAAIVSVWKRERARWHGGTIHPVANRPDGVSWTGFVSESPDGGGYALLFRELSDDEEFKLDLRPVFGDSAPVADGVIGGRGEARSDGGVLAVRIFEKLDFAWVRLAAKQPAGRTADL